jgi:hypothetical protein
MAVPDEYLHDVTQRFRDYRSLTERAIAQVPDDQLFHVLDPESNSIAVLMRHLAGNMRSRWRDFLTTDGEKPDRHRDGEFVIPSGLTRADLLADWASGWQCLFDNLARLQPADLERTVLTRHEPTSALSAINRQLGHAALHCGQIVFLAKHLQRASWKTLSIARGQSDAFNEEMKKKFSSS